MKIIYYIFIIIILLTGYVINNSKEISSQISDISEPNVQDIMIPKTNLVNPEGSKIEERYSTPKDYTRVEVSEDSFGKFLRNSKLKSYGEKVLYYDGRIKNKSNVYDSVFDVEIGNRDLHQCADAIMLLRAEYLYSQELYDQIHFNFVSGFNARYDKWMEGYRIKVEGNNVSYYKATEPSNTYETFRKFMDMVFAYSGTLSLENELDNVKVEEMEIGDVFIVGGSPGHAVTVVDMAVKRNRRKDVHACPILYAGTTNSNSYKSNWQDHKSMVQGMLWRAFDYTRMDLWLGSFKKI